MSNKHEEDEGEGELNLIPYLDIITNLVIFLVFSFQVIIEFRLIGIVPPAHGSGGGGSATEQPMSITTIIHTKGYRIVGSNDIMGAIEIPLKDGKHDTDRLHDELVRLKREYSLAEQMVVTASLSTEYKVIVATMDAARNDGKAWLFPDIMLARGG